MRRKVVTVQDIALAIGCSPSAVSRALNNKPGISEDTRSKVRLTALDMGYVFKKNGKMPSPKGGRVQESCISVVVTRENFLDDGFYRKIIHGIESVLNHKKIAFFLSILEKDHQQDVLNKLRQMRPDGIIVFGLVSQWTITEILQCGLPTVFVDTVHLHVKMDRITIDNYYGCFEAVKYLLSMGHRRIAFLGDNAFSGNIAERCRGCREGVERGKGEWIPAEGIVRMEQSGLILLDSARFAALMRQSDRPTAIVCASDQVAFAVYNAAAEVGLSLPEDLSVIGFDNVDKCEWVNPPLTSVEVPKFQMGQLAVKLLLDRIAEPDKATGLLQLDTSLQIRSSVLSLGG